MLIMALMTGLFNSNLYAQNYGGSASVWVKDKNGNTYVSNSTTPCVWSTRSLAKEKLTPFKGSNEEFTSAVDYEIDECNDNDHKKYGGSSSAKVKDRNGETKTKNETTPCIWSTPSLAREKLMPYKGSNEAYVSKVYYDIDSCN